MLRSAIAAVVVIAGCGPAGVPGGMAWAKPMSETSCDEWSGRMRVADRIAASTTVVPAREALQLMIAVDDFCASFGDLGDDGQPPRISQVMELVVGTDQYCLEIAAPTAHAGHCAAAATA
jgi:hypothetical protein